MRLRLTRISAAAVLALGLCAAQPAAAQTLSDLVTSARTNGTALFGSTEFRSGKLRGLPQWTRVLGVMAKEGKRFRACAADPADDDA